MIIKNYASDGALHLYENVTDVVCHQGIYDCSNPEDVYREDFGPQNGEHFIVWSRNYSDKPDNWALMGVSYCEDDRCMIVDYKEKDGTPFRLIVEHLAYVCNDDGKTIEKVKV